MNANDLLEQWGVYREMLATHEMLRKLGFPAEEIFAFIGLNSAIILRTQGREFSVAFPALPMPLEEFSDGWRTIAEQIQEVRQELLDRCVEEWQDKYSRPEFVVAIQSKGINIAKARAVIH